MKNKMNHLLDKINDLFKKGYAPIISFRNEMLVIEFEDLQLMRLDKTGKSTYICNFEKRPTSFFTQDEIKFMIDLLYEKMDKDDTKRADIYKQKDKTAIPTWLKDLK